MNLDLTEQEVSNLYIKPVQDAIVAAFVKIDNGEPLTEQENQLLGFVTQCLGVCLENKVSLGTGYFKVE